MVLAPVKFRRPMECKTISKVPEGEEWQYELKLDGYRAQAIKSDGEVHLYSCDGKSYDHTFADIVRDLDQLRELQQFVIDGEIVAFDEQGHHSFSLLQNTRQNGAIVHFFAFDIMELNGKDLTRLPLSRRREILEREFHSMRGSFLRLAPVLDFPPASIMEHVRNLRLEGIVAKRKGSHYVWDEETADWQKYKVHQSADFLIGGYIPNGKKVDQLIVGEEKDGSLLYVDSVKNGLVPSTRHKVFNILAGLTTTGCPFSNLPEKTPGAHRMDREKMRRVTWVRPQVWAEIAFNEVTNSGHLRDSKFLRLREDGDLRDA
jgi:DNA ligase D-like protein (predicted ligase)